MTPPADLLRNLLVNTFGLDDFRPGQRQVIEALIRRENIVTVMPTGSGKSLCYQLPALAADGITVVVSPLIALMIDQIRSLRSRRIAVGGIYSGMGSSERTETFRALTKDALKILYISPERFNNESFLDLLKDKKVAHFIVDEAHCVSQWGHDFRVEYLALKNIIKILGNPPVGAFTATATQEVRRDIEIQLGIEGASYFFTGFDRENLSLEVRPTPAKKKKLAEIYSLLNEEAGSAIVYCATRADTEDIEADLRKRGLSVVRYHAGLKDQERALSQKLFISGERRIIVATCAFGMGIDKPDIRLVIHHAIPGSVETYYQEIGRAGRDGVRARCILLWNFPDSEIRRYFIDKSESGRKSAAIKAAETRRLEKMIHYAQCYQCRRGFIIDYFAGRHVIFKCGICDNCGGFNQKTQSKASETVAKVREKDSQAKAVSSMDAVAPAGAAVTSARAKRQKRERTGAEANEGTASGETSRSNRPQGVEHDAPFTEAAGESVAAGAAEEDMPLQGTPESLEWARMTLSCIERIRRANVAPNLRNVAEVLRGVRSDEVKKHGLDTLSTWNLFVGWKKSEISRIFRTLRSVRLIELREGSLQITDQGRVVMFGKESASIPFDRDVAVSASIIETAEPISEEHYDPALYEKLRTWRSARAKAEGVPPYLVAHDKTLKNIAVSRPSSMEKLLAVKGMGPAKVEKYGEELLAIM